MMAIKEIVRRTSIIETPRDELEKNEVFIKRFLRVALRNKDQSNDNRPNDYS